VCVCVCMYGIECNHCRLLRSWLSFQPISTDVHCCRMQPPLDFEIWRIATNFLIEKCFSLSFGVGEMKYHNCCNPGKNLLDYPWKNSFRRPCTCPQLGIGLPRNQQCAEPVQGQVERDSHSKTSCLACQLPSPQQSELHALLASFLLWPCHLQTAVHFEFAKDKYTFGMRLGTMRSFYNIEGKDEGSPR